MSIENTYLFHLSNWWKDGLIKKLTDLISMDLMLRDNFKWVIYHGKVCIVLRCGAIHGYYRNYNRARLGHILEIEGGNPMAQF